MVCSTDSSATAFVVHFYDPTTATFLTRDPLETLTRDAYGYANASPHNYTDPSGLAPWDGVCIRGVNCAWNSPRAYASQQQSVANFAAGVLDGITVGNGRDVVNATTGAGDNADWESGEAMAGSIVGTLLVSRFAMNPASARGFATYSTYGAAGSTYGRCTENGIGSVDFRSCLQHAGVAAASWGYSRIFGLLGPEIANGMSIVMSPFERGAHYGVSQGFGPPGCE